jgi:FG-GAP-like repeat
MDRNLFLTPIFIFAACMVQAQPKFESQVIDPNVEIGYGLAIGDVDGDGRQDILLADKKQFVWYRNGDWKRFVMVDNLTAADNVCIAARDINQDGKVEVAVGAQWNPGETSDTAKSGSVHYLIRPADPTQRWVPVKLYHEATIHRMRWVKAGQNNFDLIVLPLHGKGNKNGEGTPVNVLAYDVPQDPHSTWKHSAIDQSMHLTHNFDIVPNGDSELIYVGGKEGIRVLGFQNGKWSAVESLTKGDAFGEIRVSKTKGIAAIQPMHGNQLVAYPGDGNFSRNVLATDLNQGHALAYDQFLPSGEQIVAGWREPNSEKKTGIKIFVFQPEKEKWENYWIDENGIACEDLQVADLNGDGKKDIVAAGRSSHNLKIYWNRN